MKPSTIILAVFCLALIANFIALVRFLRAMKKLQASQALLDTMIARMMGPKAP